MNPEIFANCAVTQLTAAELEVRMIKRQSGGQLYLSTGAIVACDPLVQWERPAFTRTVAIGRYPVTFYSRGRLGVAEVRFADDPVVRWELAVLPGQDIGSLEANEIFGYPVDAGVGCFMDAAVRPLLEQREAQALAERGEEYVSYYDDVLCDELEDTADGFDFDWCAHHPIADDPHGAIIFGSGWGDGFYASFWGLAADGRVVLLATDFGVFKDADARSADELATARRIESMPAAHRGDESGVCGDGMSALISTMLAC